MAEILGGVIGFYIFYALLAAIFKHRIGLIITATLAFLSGFFNAFIFQDFFMLITAIIGTTVVALVDSIQIRKDAAKKDNENKQDCEQDNKDE